MKIQIDDNYQIVSDSMQYILQETKEVMEGENKGLPYVTNVGYYGKIYSVLRSYKELQIRNSNVTTIKELMDLIKSLDEKIEALLKSN